MLHFVVVILLERWHHVAAKTVVKVAQIDVFVAGTTVAASAVAKRPVRASRGVMVSESTEP